MAIYARGNNKSKGWSHEFGQVLSAELEAIRNNGGHDDETINQVIARAHQSRLLGVAFSGGGIRSATFNLGVLQALAKFRLFEKLDYLSTVSGGGYIGSWLMAWLIRRGRADVKGGLTPEWESQPGREETPEIRFLRRFSNYLTPKLGWFGADMWTVIAIYLRNLILNLIVLVAVLSALLLIPREIGWVGYHYAETNADVFAPNGLWLLPAILLLISGVCISVNLNSFRRASSRPSTGELDAGDPEVDDLLAFPSRWFHVDKGAAATLTTLDDFNCASGKLFFREELADFLLTVKFTPKQRGLTPNIYLHVRPAGEEVETSMTPLRRGIESVRRFWLGLRSQYAEFELDSAMFAALATAATTGERIAKELQDETTVVANQESKLEIACADGVYTIRLNGHTVHSFRRPTTLPGWLGLECTKQIELKHVLLRRLSKPAVWLTSQSAVQVFGVLPVLFAAFLTAAVLWKHEITVPLTWPLSQWLNGLPPWQRFAVLGALFASVLTLCSLILRIIFNRVRNAYRNFLTRDEVPEKSAKQEAERRARKRSYRQRQWSDEIAILITMTLSGGVGGICVAGVASVIHGRSLWMAIAVGPPLLVASMLFGNVLHLGMMGRVYTDDVREWWSRFTAWLLISAIVWVAVFGTALYMPAVMRWARGILIALGTGWIATTVAGLIAAKSSATGKAHASRAKELIAVVAPYVFIVGMFAALSLGVDAALLKYSGFPPTFFPPTIDASGKAQAVDFNLLHKQVHDHHWNLLNRVSGGETLVGCGAALAIALLLSWRLDINQFSMHMLYRNRLARCYLGASNKGPREPQRFTGLDPSDDFDLVELQRLFRVPGNPVGPYPILNAALNLVGGDELAWQQRKAASFVFTPTYCGYEFPELPPGFVKTGQYAGSKYRPTLGTAMAISGAAASPNAGYHTSPAAAFLMTVFNVRLGWWMGNPRNKRGYEKSSPAVLLVHLLFELFGMTKASGRHVYLSDGGHFENLGIYELVRRRCRFIIACDAEEDHTFGFGGLGNAIEKCRSDLGVEIEIDVEPIRRRNEAGHSRWHCALGKIRYSAVDGGDYEGTLLYLKSSLTGDEPTDVLRYADANPEFPHQSTGDQWFDESQFESYRALGFHVATEVLSSLEDLRSGEPVQPEKLFVQLRQQWYPPSEAVAGAFTKHSRALVAINNELQTNTKLAFLTRELYPEWRQLYPEAPADAANGGKPLSPASTRRWLSEDEEVFRQGFYLCSSMIQLMEDVYLDLHLEQDHAHPDNRGWMNLFKHWSWSGTFRVAWTIAASTYGARFQTFCEQQLGLVLGTVRVTDCPQTVTQIVREDQPQAGSLNDVERELIRDFFRSPDQLSLVEQCTIHLLQISPGKEGDRDRAPMFTFGFAVTCPKPDPEARELILFRVQDHLRKMGLARRGLKELLRQGPITFNPVPASYESGRPTAEERRRLCRLLESVRSELA